MDQRVQESGKVPEVVSLLIPLSHFLDIRTFQVRSTLGKHLRLGVKGRRVAERSWWNIFNMLKCSHQAESPLGPAAEQ